MDPNRDLHPRLRPPGHGDQVRLTWSASFGPRVRAGRLGVHLSDLETALLLGERWGERLARAAAYQSLIARFDREGPRAFDREMRRSVLPPWEAEAVEEWFMTGRWRAWRPGRSVYADPFDALRALADIRSPEQLGQPTRVVTASYQNPIEVVLTGSGFLVAGAIYALRMARDWSNKRRLDAAGARGAEARARGEEARAELLHWLVDEAKSGRMPVPAGDLLQLVTPTDVEAVDRLADDEITLQLPPGTDEGGDQGGE